MIAMTKDYAQRRRTIDASNAPGGYFIKWLCLVMILSLVGSGLIYWQKQIKGTEKQRKIKTSATAINKKVSKIAKETSARFDFYQVLPNLGAETLEESPTPSPSSKVLATNPNKPLLVTPKPSTTPTRTLTTATEKYLIQVGSFRNQKQAEELRANLALAGFEVRMQTVKLSQTNIWYRITVGPFESKEKADLTRLKLEQSYALHSLVLKMQV